MKNKFITKVIDYISENMFGRKLINNYIKIKSKIKIIRNSSGFLFLNKSDNRLIGYKPEMENSKIVFKGKNNIIYCEKNVKLKDCIIKFNGDNSIVFLRHNQFDYTFEVNLYNDCVCSFGKNNYFNKGVVFILSEQKHCFVGDNCMFSSDVCVRNADPHLIYDINDKHRLNYSQSVLIGDHVWIGQSAMLLKGTQIDSGAIIGAKSLVSGKKIPNNTSWGGVPAKIISEGIFWDPNCVHDWDENKTLSSRFYYEFVDENKTERFIFDFEKNQSILFDEIDKSLSELCVEGKIDYLKELYNNTNKNRFVHKIDCCK